MGTSGNDGAVWAPTWTQAVTDFRGDTDESPFHHETVRMTVPASIGGHRVRLELSNCFGDQPLHIGRGAVGIGGLFVELAFAGRGSTEIPPAGSLWSDPVELGVRHGDTVVVDVYLPAATPYATAGGFSFDRSTTGDFAGSPDFRAVGSGPTDVEEPREFPAANTMSDSAADESGWSLPAGGPFLRTVEVEGAPPSAVIVCLGGSSTAMGWPQYAAALFSSDARVAVLNRGISGNRLRLDAPEQTPSWGRAGLSRLDDDVLTTRGVTHVIVAYNNNDWTLPGRVTPASEMPSVRQVIDAYRAVVDRAGARDVDVTLATVSPLAPELATDRAREGIRLAVNDWIRSSTHACLDFDAAIRSDRDPAALSDHFAAPDHTHPSVAGQRRLAQVTVDNLTALLAVPLEK